MAIILSFALLPWQPIRKATVKDCFGSLFIKGFKNTRYEEIVDYAWTPNFDFYRELILKYCFSFCLFRQLLQDSHWIET